MQTLKEYKCANEKMNREMRSLREQDRTEQDEEVMSQSQQA
jgi:hypothetical protein